MAVTDEQIRAVLAANPNASDERIIKALANYGVSPERFISVTGRRLEPFSSLFDQINYYPTKSEQPPSQTPTASQASDTDITPVTNTAAKATASGVPYSRIKTALERNPNATPDQIADVMVDYGITPDDMRRVLGQSFAGNTDIRQAYGRAGGYTDQQIRDAVMGRAGTQAFATQPEIQKAAQNYGITPEQLARVFPQVQPGSLNQIPITTSEYGLPAAVSAVGRAADVTRQTSEEGQQKLVNRIKQIGQAVGGIYDEAQGYQQTYRDLGQEAAQRQAALTGALGPEAQAQAFADYQASPELAFRQQRGEEAITRQAAALGGLGGGNVRKALAQFTSDLYSQDLSNRLAQLGDIATRGYGAGATSAQLGGQEAGTISGLGQAGAITAAQIQDALSGRLGNILLKEADYRSQAGRDLSENIGAATGTIGGLQVGAGDAYRQQLGQLTGQQLDFYNDLASTYGQTFADEYMAKVNANLATAGGLGGVPMTQLQTPEGYNVGDALQNTADAYRLGGLMFNNQQQQNQSGYQFGGQPIPSGGNTGGGINYDRMYGY